MIEFDKIMNEYFISYTLLFEPSIKRPGNNSGTILIKKINLSKVEMSHIKTKLKKNGWIEIESDDNYSLYCLNKYQLIGILYPINLIEKNKDGDEIVFDDIDSWNIGLYYNENGINSCENYFEK